MATVVGTDDAELIDAEDGVTDSFDEIFALGGDDTIFGLGGGDNIYGGLGSDSIDGGDGSDFVIYDGSASSVFVSLVTGGVGGEANGDIYVSVEYVSGSNFDDFLTGNEVHNLFVGNAGRDLMRGLGGPDTLHGDEGNDILEAGDGDDFGCFGGEGDDRIEGEAGNDQNLSGGAGNDTILGGDGDDELLDGDGADKMDGGAGIDEAWFLGSAVGLSIDLIAGTVSNGGTLSGIEHAFGTSFGDVISGDAFGNRLFGSLGNDVLNGRDGADELFGFVGNDVLVGGTGADSLTGGDGFDRSFYAGSNAAVIINLALGTASGGHAQGDVLAEIEGVIGSDFSDALTGTAGGADSLGGAGGNDTLGGSGGNDTLRGGNGDDLVTGGIGADVLNGGGGRDRVNYAACNAAVTLNLAVGTASGGHAQGDRLTEIEIVTGSRFADLLAGNAAANGLEGQAGSDVLIGGAGNDTLAGGAGADEIYGGAGLDFADYAASAAAVQIDLGAETATGGHAQGDTLAGIEVLLGSNFGDRLAGNAAANRLFGRDGRDQLSGAAGDDLLLGLAGNDSLTGGAGLDIFRYPSALFGKDVITDFQNGSDKIDLRGSGLTFASFTETQPGANTVLTLTSNPANTITLAGIDAALIDAGDFLV